MALTVNINGLTLVHRASDGTAIATAPDVCVTPGVGPVPYPNVAFSKDLAKGTKTVFADGGNMIAIKGSEFAISTGDEPGTLGGVKSGTFKREATWITYSMDVKIEGRNACRLTDKMFMNHGNTVCLGGEIQGFIDVLSTLGELEALCRIYCSCLGLGNQSCVAEKLELLDTAMGGASPMLPEIPYNTLSSPPAPMMSTENPRRGATNWRFPNHPSYPSGYTPGAGHVVRPDVVLVKNPAAPPAGNNLAAVVEMKFPNDPWDTENMMMREVQYERIARENNPEAPYVRMDQNTCRCAPNPEPVPVPVPVPVPERNPAPARSWDGLGELLGGTALGLGGAALAAVSTVASGALILDDATGVGVLNDPLLVVTGGGMVAGGAAMAQGASMMGSGLKKLFGF